MLDHGSTRVDSADSGSDAELVALGTSEIDADYVDTYCASVVGFAFPDLLGCLPRLKSIGPH